MSDSAGLSGQFSLDTSRVDRFCILGAGSSGLAVAKNFREQGIPVDCLEREDDVGGNWNYGKPHSSVYRSTRLISSKRGTQYSDFPMPADWPEHPPHDLVLAYLQNYASHFGLHEDIEFNTAVAKIEPADDGRYAAPSRTAAANAPAAGWDVLLADGSRRRYRGVVIANGHHWDPRWPDYAGDFDGLILHSSQYKAPDEFRGKRVLVVGGGNSGFDIAAEVASQASATFHSLRRSYHLLPRFFRGEPVDERGEWALRWGVPLWLRRLRAKRLQTAAWGLEVASALPRPDHRLFETHPVINSRWPYAVSLGAIRVTQDVREMNGGQVTFADGSREQVDVVIYATGYKLSFPFIDPAHLNWGGSRPELYLNIFHPVRDDLFIAGLIQPDSGQFGLVDYQAKLIAVYVRGLDGGIESARRFQQEKKTRRVNLSGGVRYMDSPRHLVEVEHYSYRRLLQRKIRQLTRRR